MGGLRLLRLLGAAFAALFIWGAVADEIRPFQPIQAGSVTIACAASSSATALSAINASAPIVQLEVQNAGSVNVFVEPGLASTITAAVASGYPVLPGQSKVISVSPRTTHIACISASGTQSVFVTAGTGN